MNAWMPGVGPAWAWGSRAPRSSSSPRRPSTCWRRWDCCSPWARCFASRAAPSMKSAMARRRTPSRPTWCSTPSGWPYRRRWPSGWNRGASNGPARCWRRWPIWAWAIRWLPSPCC
ncbi:hypothetical protein G6F40_017244 [Rhizopus arrhizus]|nr:hypothetical protein G6F40_017244 [Rhizopus arrhizus]